MQQRKDSRYSPKKLKFMESAGALDTTQVLPVAFLVRAEQTFYLVAAFKCMQGPP